MSRWGRNRRRAIAAALALTVPASLVSSAASADQVPNFPAYVAALPGTSCVPEDRAGVVNSTAWAEIERLGDLGLPVCDIDWHFTADRDEWWWWGYAMPASSPAERPDVWIIEDVAAYAVEGEDAVDGELLEQHVRTTVRHELGHALTYLLEIDEATLTRLFPAELAFSYDYTHAGAEASAEAIAVVLTPSDEERTVFFVEDVSEENVRTAEAILDAFVTD